MFKKKSFLFLVLLLIIVISFTVAAKDFKRVPRINLRGITSDDFIGQAGLLYPFRNTKNSLWFTDLRYRVSEDDIDEWNLGLGYRRKIETAENHIAGMYIFRDRREELDYYWDMWTVGGEILTDQWDFRVNAYMSDNEVLEVPESDTIQVQNNQLIYETASYSSMDGLDIELGKRFTETNTIFKNVGIYGKLFNFFESDTPTMTGRQIRIDKQFGDRDKITWKIGAQWRDDNIRGSETEATFAISIPFGEGQTDNSKIETTKEEILESRMTEQPERDLDVIVGKNKGGSEAGGNIAYDPLTGEKMDNIEFISADFDNLAEKINNSKAKVIVLVGNGKDIILNKTIELAKGQKLLSPTGLLLLSADPEGVRSTFFKPQGEQASLKLDENNFNGDNAIKLVSDNTVSGLEIVNNSGNNKGIYKETLDVNNAPDIRNNEIKNFDYGIYFEEISGEDEQNKLDNLKKFNTEYEEINEISGAKIVDVHDHIIKDWYDLDSVRYNLNGVYLMKNSLDKETNGYTKLASLDANEKMGWAPLGDLSNPFSGYFEGQNYRINDLNIKRETDSYIGLFGAIKDSKIINLGLKNANITGNDRVGGLVGNNKNGNITNIYASGNISGNYRVGGLVGYNDYNGTIVNSYAAGTVIGNNYVGGLVGYNTDGTIVNSYAAGTVIGNNYVGGLVGYNTDGTIDNSYATGDITGNKWVGGLVGYYTDGTIDNSYATGDITGNITGNKWVGGLVGYNYGGTIDNSYAAGNITGDDNVGGLVGFNNGGKIDNSYASGTVIGNNFVGGLVGYNVSANITNSYASGTVIGNYRVGGLVGHNVSANITNSYWNTETSGQDSSDYGESKTTEEMKVGEDDIYINWDEEIWNFGTVDEYPYLQWQGDENIPYPSEDK